MEILQEMNQKEFVRISRENDEMRGLLASLEKQRDDLRKKIEKVEEGHATRTFVFNAENVDITGNQDILIATLDLPQGKWELTLNYFALKGGNLAEAFFLSMMLFQSGKDLKAVPNDGYFCYNPSSSYASPYSVKFFVDIKHNQEKVEIKSNSNNRNDVKLSKVILVAEEFF